MMSNRRAHFGIRFRDMVVARVRSLPLTRMVLAAALAWGGSLWAQQQPPATTSQPPAAPSPVPVEAQKNPLAPCWQPAPMVSWQDYEGPMNKVVGAFGRKLERKTVHAPHFKPGAVLCSLNFEGKFLLFVNDTIDPITFLNVGFNAGIDQAENSDPTFGQGAAGYGKRFGANMADAASSAFFKDFVYPEIFSEDPRYYRMAHGSAKARLGHALEHAFVAYRDNGTQMFNFNEWLGTTSGVVLSNMYHPGNSRSVASASERVTYNVLNDMGFDVLREFWPEIAHKFKLPFRNEPHPTNSVSPSN